MGLFSSKKKTLVDTAVMRVVEDKMVPDSVLRAILQTNIDGSDVVENLRANLLSGGFRNFERMYRWAAKPGNYHYGLPDVTLLNSNQGNDRVQPIIEAEIGESITLDYVRYRPANHAHLAWKKLTEEYGFLAGTNDLSNLSAEKTEALGQQEEGNEITIKVSITKITSTYNEDPDSPPEASSISNWTGDTSLPEIPEGLDSGLGWLYGGSNYHWVDEVRYGPGELDGAIIEYQWRDENDEAHTDTLNFSFNYDGEQEFFHARYSYEHSTLGTQRGYWFYDPSEERHAELDTLFDPRSLSYANPGTYFPFAIFRRDKDNRASENKIGTAEYDSTKELLKFIDVDFAELGAQIHENPDVQDVAQAVMMMAVPLTTEDQIELDYLHRYFKRLIGQLPREATTSVTELMPPRAQNNYSSTQLNEVASHAIVIKDADFEVNLSFEHLSATLKRGTIGEIGEFTNTLEIHEMIENWFELPPGTTFRRRIIRKQIYPGLFEEVVISDPKTRYQITRKKGVNGFADDERLLIPLDYNITRNMPTSDKEDLYYRSLHLVFNSAVVTKTKWYETKIFQTILVVVAIAITIYTLGQTWQAAVAAAGVGAATSAVVVIFIQLILQQMLIGFVLKLAFAQLVELIGVELAFLVAVVLAVYGMSKGFNAVGVEKATADNLLNASTGLTSAIDADIQKGVAELIDEQGEFQLFAEAKNTELEEANALLDNNTVINPYEFVGREPTVYPNEAPTDFYNRTTHIGNPGVLSLQIIENFVDISIKLPQLN
jgi:hypothetical protein